MAIPARFCSSNTLTKKRRRATITRSAILWGKHEFVEDGAQTAQPFALATALSTALERLNLDLFAQYNADDELIWGWVEFTQVIGNTLPATIKLLTAPAVQSLGKFLTKHMALLSMNPNDALR